MDMRICIITVFCLIGNLIMSAKDMASDSIEAKVMMHADSLELQVTAYQVNNQLIFLMQGLNIDIIQPDTVNISFPSAMMVRHRVRRHPNEVKAELACCRNVHEAGHDSVNKVVRPDVLPLVSALNDTIATLAHGGHKYVTRDFNIEVNREDAVMTFSIKINRDWLASSDGPVELYISSLPMNGCKAEFSGHRLSNERSPSPNGLGEGLNEENAASRTIKRRLHVKIDGNDEL